MIKAGIMIVLIGIAIFVAGYIPTPHIVGLVFFGALLFAAGLLLTFSRSIESPDEDVAEQSESS